MQDVKYYYMYDEDGVIHSVMTGVEGNPPEALPGFSIISSVVKQNTHNLHVDVSKKEFVVITPELSTEEKNAQILELRKVAYTKESDPLYMEWQYDKTEESESLWRDKVKEIKLRYPIT